MHLKIGHGHEVRFRKESYIVLSPKITHNLLYPSNNKMNKMAYFSYLKNPILVPFDFIFSSGPILLPNQLLRLLLWLGELTKVVFMCIFYWDFDRKHIGDFYYEPR